MVKDGHDAEVGHTREVKGEGHLPSREASDHNDQTTIMQGGDGQMVQDVQPDVLDDSKQIFGVDNVRAMHCNELF